MGSTFGSDGVSDVAEDAGGVLVLGAGVGAALFPPHAVNILPTITTLSTVDSNFFIILPPKNSFFI